MRMNDYRSTDTNIFPAEKEINSCRDVVLKGYKGVNHYSFIHKKSTVANQEFRKSFNFKCAYCGVNELINPVSLFEVDHYICKSSKRLHLDFNNIDNLINSCYECNRHKSCFDIEDEYLDILNPKKNIQNVFVRDNLFKIVINSKYNTDGYIVKFYEKMNFDHDLHRVDFLIMSMIDLEKKMSNTCIKDKLNVMIGKLLQKRNRIIP